MRPEKPPAVVGYVLRKFPVLSETFILNEMLRLEERGVPLHVFSLQRPNDPRFHEDLPRLKARVTYVPEFTELSRLLQHNRRLAGNAAKAYRQTLLYALATGRPGLLWRLLQSGFVANEARRLRITHLHAQFANCPATVAFLASRLAGIPYSFTAHAMDIFKEEVDLKALARKIESARFVVTVSDFNKSYMEEAASAPAGRIVRIYNGIDLERFQPNGTPPATPFRILCVARLVEKKGIADLIEACRILRERGIDFTCDIAGKGRLRSRLEEQIRRSGLGDRVRILGPMTQMEVRELYRSSHLYALPCIVGSDGNREGLPVSIVEALASGLPVISTRVTGIPEVVHDGVNGFLVPMNDPAGLSDAIARLAGDRSLYETLRQNARSSVCGEFDHRRTSRALHELLEAS